MVAQTRSNTRSCQEINHYQKKQYGNIFLLRCLTASCLFAHEGEDVLVACSCKKKMWLWIASFGKSYNGVMLHFAKQ